MNAPSHTYVHADTPFETELLRLRCLETRYDAVTRTRLEIAGSLVGMHCLEVGAGAGSVTRMLSEAVGPTGHVTALDRDPRFLRDLTLANVTVRQHDVMVDELEQSAYDVVHCRALLLHLSDPVTALRRMIAALRPGGLLVAEDADFSSLAAVPGHPLSAEVNRLIQLWAESDVPRMAFDPYFGAKLPGLLAALGLVGCGENVLRVVQSGGSPEAEVMAMGIETARRVAGPGGLPDGTDFSPVIAALRDPAFSYVDSLNVGAWGRRPMPGYLG